MQKDTPGYQIRAFEREDLASLEGLQQALVDEDTAYRRAPGEYGDDGSDSFAKSILRVLDNPNSACVVAVSPPEGREVVIGYARFVQNDSRRRTRHTGSFGIGVREGFRSRGVGQALLKALLDRLRDTEIERVSLHVFQDNPGALRFYERHGFTASGTLPGEIKMEDGRYRDLVLMHRWIKPYK